MVSAPPAGQSPLGALPQTSTAECELRSPLCTARGAGRRPSEERGRPTAT